MAAGRANRKTEEKITRSGSRFNFFFNPVPSRKNRDRKTPSRPVPKKIGIENPIPSRPDSIFFNPDPEIPIFGIKMPTPGNASKAKCVEWL